MGIREFISEEDKVLKKASESFKNKIQAFDMMAIVTREAARSAELTKAKQQDVATFFIQLLHQVHVYLRLSFLLTLLNRTPSRRAFGGGVRKKA